MEFINKITDEVMNHLKEGVNDYEDEYVNTQTVFDLENIKSYLDQIKLN